jgi:PAS domain S-box-containing protein
VEERKDIDMPEHRGDPPPAIKAKVAVAALRGEDPEHLAERYEIDAADVIRWQARLEAEAASLFEPPPPLPADDIGDWAPRDGAAQPFTRRVLDSLFGFVGVLTTDGTLIGANDAPLAAAGITFADVQGRKFWDCYWWSWSETARARLRDACARAANGEVVRYDVAVRMAGDTRMVIDFQVAPLRDASGRITHLVPSAFDVTERTRAERERLRLAELVEHSSDLIALSDLDGSLRYVNAAGRQMGGLARDGGLSGLHLIDFAAPDNLDRLTSEVLPAVREGGRWEGEMRLRHLETDACIDAFCSLFLIRDPATSAPVGFGAVSRDVTLAKQAEAALRASEAKLAAVIEALPVGLGITDASGRVLSLNPSGRRLHGFTDEEDILPTLDDYRLHFELRRTDGSALPFEQWPMARALRGEEVSGVELRLRRRADGEERLIAYNVVRLGGGDDSSFIVFLMQDVTERARQEEEVRRRAEEIAKLMELVPAAVFVASDRECIQMTGNRQALSFYEADPEENVSAGVSRRRRFFENGRELPPEELPMQVAAATGKDVRNAELEVLLPSGRSITIWGSATPLRDATGEIRGCIGAFLETTERKRAQERLRESEERFRTLADNIAQLAWMADETGRVFWYNRRWHDYTGTAAEPADPRDWWNFQHPDEAARVRVGVARALAGGSEWDDVLPLRGADGGYRWFLCKAVPIRDANGRVTRWFGTGTDINEQREADQRKDEFLATLAHELRNPLAPIRAALEIQRLCGGDPSMLREAQEIMERQVEHLVRLVDDLLDVSRVTRGAIALRRERLGLAEVVRQALETSGPALKEARRRLTVQIPDEPLALYADPVRLVQVISNLLNNAARYTGEDGHVRLTVSRDAGEAVISVADDGIGIAPDMLPRVFEMFSQADRAHGGGLGIGLTVVRSLVAMHGGRVDARSPGLGQGSEFVVRLPLAEVETAPARPHREAPTAAARGQRVLVVDDNQDAADSLGALLRLFGAQVQVVHDGPAALEALAQTGAETVFLDIGMPGMDGYEVARRIRSGVAGADVLLIAVTGWSQEEDRRRVREAGFDAHLTKPVGVDDLSRVLERRVSRASAPDSPRAGGNA